MAFVETRPNCLMLERLLLTLVRETALIVAGLICRRLEFSDGRADRRYGPLYFSQFLSPLGLVRPCSFELRVFVYALRLLRLLLNQCRQVLLVPGALDDRVLQFFEALLFPLPLGQFGLQLFHTLQFGKGGTRWPESNRQQIILKGPFTSPCQKLS